MITLNEDQQLVHDGVIAAYKRGEKEVLIIGSAGVGKTSLLTEIARSISNIIRKSAERRVQMAICAPTHKAVQVLARKLDAAGLEHIGRMTIHAMLGLKPAVSDSERQVLKRNPAGKSKVGFFDVVAIDESSMVGRDLQNFIDSDLTFHFVIYVGDKAQLPPVGEEIAPCFTMVPERNTLRLHEIVRQAEGNPILQAATQLRLLQEPENAGVMRWDWLRENVNPETNQGVYDCGSGVDGWLREAFMSSDFKQDNDFYRYIAYTNYRVKEVNFKIRHWIYGQTDTPFVAGERVLCRNPVLDHMQNPVFTTNEEAFVTKIEADKKLFYFGSCGAAAGQAALTEWHYEMPVWKIGLRRLESDDNSDALVYAYIPQDQNHLMGLEARLKTEAKANRNRWREFFSVKEEVADIRPVYALTAHSSQGSTFGFAFVDIPDIARRLQTNMQEAKKLMYVAVTRASQGVVLVGV